MGTVGPGGGAEQGQARSAEDVRAYVQKMRSLPVEQLVGDVLFSLLNAAQVKLGRRDARLLIDVSTVVLEHAALSAGRTHHAGRPGTGTAAAGPGERGGPREPGRQAGGQRSRPGTGPAAVGCRAITCRAGRQQAVGSRALKPY